MPLSLVPNSYSWHGSIIKDYSWTVELNTTTSLADPPLSPSRGPALRVTYHTGNSALTVSSHIISLSDRTYNFTCFLSLRYLICWGFQDVFGLQSKTTVWHTEECFITSPENKVFLRKTISLRPHATPLLPYQQLLLAKAQLLYKIFLRTMFSLKNWVWSSANWRFDVTEDLNPARKLNSLKTERKTFANVLFAFLLWNKIWPSTYLGRTPTRAVEILFHDRKSGLGKKPLCSLSNKMESFFPDIPMLIPRARLAGEQHWLGERRRQPGEEMETTEVLDSATEFTVNHDCSPFVPRFKLLARR